MREGAVSTADCSPVDINLCAGAGGLALGLAQAGFVPSEFYDKDRGSCETMRHNLRGSSIVLRGRVFEGDLSQIEWIPRGQRVRLLAAGAPCQPFSIGGAHRGHEDERNLFPTIMKAVRFLRPRAVLIENVRGLNRVSQYPYLQYIISQLRYPDIEPKHDETWDDHAQRLRQHSGDRFAHPTYRVVWSVLNAADFGVAQLRHRLFIVATGVDFPEYMFPTPTHSKKKLQFEQATGIYWERRGLPAPDGDGRPRPKLDGEEDLLPWSTVRDALSDLPDPAPQENVDCNNHWTIPGARTYPGHTGSLLDQPSKTLKAGVHGVPGGENMKALEDGSVQYYTLREMARIQSFPDSHYFVGARSNVIRQIGNAVPCVLASRVADPLRKVLDAKIYHQEERAGGWPHRWRLRV